MSHWTFFDLKHKYISSNSTKISQKTAWFASEVANLVKLPLCSLVKRHYMSAGGNERFHFALKCENTGPFSVHCD